MLHLLYGESMLSFNRFILGKARCQRGMTIIEILFSFGILALFALTSLKLIAMSQQVTIDTQSKIIAMGAARSVMEKVKTTPLSDVDVIVTSSYLPSDLSGGSISILTSPSGVGLDTATIGTITVRVSWTGSRGRAQSFDLTTLKSSYDHV